MIILKCTKSVQFKNGHHLFLNKNIYKILRDALDKNHTFTFHEITE